MLDSLVRVSRRVLRVPETESSQTDTRTVRDSTAATTGAPHPHPHSGRKGDTTLPCVGPDARERVHVSYKLPSDGRSVHLTVYTTRGSEDSRRALTPTSNGSRCITKREVHAVPGARRTRRVHADRGRHASRRRTCAEE